MCNSLPIWNMFRHGGQDSEIGLEPNGRTANTTADNLNTYTKKKASENCWSFYFNSIPFLKLKRWWLTAEMTILGPFDIAETCSSSPLNAFFHTLKLCNRLSHNLMRVQSAQALNNVFSGIPFCNQRVDFSISYQF